MEVQELYLTPLALCYEICNEGVLCCTGETNLEDPDVDTSTGW